MSEAADLIADVKRSVARVERGITSFEQDVETVGGWTDLAQLRIAAQRLHLFEDSLRARRVDLEQATAPGTEPEASVVAQQPAGEPGPGTVEGSDAPEVSADTGAQDEPAPEAKSKAKGA